MWSTIVSLVLKFVDTTYFKVLWIVSLCFCVASLTYKYQEHKYEAELADIKTSLAEATAKQEKEYAERLTKATSDLVLANRRADTARSERDALLDRLHNANDSETKRANQNPDRSYRDEYAACRKFLLEGAELLSEGDDLARKFASEKDAVVQIVR